MNSTFVSFQEEDSYQRYWAFLLVEMDLRAKEPTLLSNNLLDYWKIEMLFSCFKAPVSPSGVFIPGKQVGPEEDIQRGT